jgi:hypothetical protein
MCYAVSMSTSEPGPGKRPRSQRGAVEERWRKRGTDEHGNTLEVPSAVAGKVTRWRARYVENAGKEHTRHFDRKVDAEKWLKEAMASIVRSDYVAPKVARLTVGEWSDKWLDGYAVPAGLRPAILLGAHAGLRLAEVATLRPEDVDFIRGVVSPRSSGQTSQGRTPARRPSRSRTNSPWSSPPPSSEGEG